MTGGIPMSLRQFHAVNFKDVKLTGPFWSERLNTVLDTTIPSQYGKLVEYNMVESLKVVQPPPPLTIPRNNHNFTTQIFWDSDIGKWVEAASYALAHGPNPDIEKKIDEIVDLWEKAQLPDGYLNTWYIGREIGNRWTNLRDNHELYNAGHMLEGAIAYFQTTGKRKFLGLMEKYMEHISRILGPGTDQKHGYCGHQEIEIALVKLYHLTKEKRWLDLCTYFINERGKQPHYFDHEAHARGADPKTFVQKTHEYSQSHKPVREQTKVVGHAVRAFYMFTAMADLAAELDDKSLKRACEVLWRDAVATKMYVTAGFGPSASNEGFTSDYDLPNDTAYAETCATVAMVFFANRMLHLDLDRQYADIMELGLYNGALSGLSREGTTYFYENKLESDGRDNRWKWHHCPCCSMNVSRLIASIGGYFCSTGKHLIAIHLYGGADADINLDGNRVKLSERSNYPWDGAISIAVSPETERTFTLKLRIPAWAETAAKASVNGKPVTIKGKLDRGYLAIKRAWKKGDVVNLVLPMNVRRIYANPLVRADQNKVALARGPLVYCVEQIDNGKAPVSTLMLPRRAKISASKKKTLGGITVLKSNGKALSRKGWEGSLYLNLPPVKTDATITAIPYYAWNNRGPNAMRVWVNEES
jgi:uncharacterized protein